MFNFRFRANQWKIMNHTNKLKTSLEMCKNDLISINLHNEWTHCLFKKISVNFFLYILTLYRHLEILVFLFVIHELCIHRSKHYEFNLIFPVSRAIPFCSDAVLNQFTNKQHLFIFFFLSNKLFVNEYEVIFGSCDIYSMCLSYILSTSKKWYEI